MRFEYWRHYLRARMLELVRRRDAALTEYRLALRFDPRNARLTSAIAYRHAQRGDWREAASGFTTALELAPRDASALFNLGFAYEHLGEHESAIGAFRQAVELQPTLDRAWYGLGMSYARLGRHGEAAQALAEAAGLQPMNGIAWYALGMAHHASHAPDKVEEVVRHLLRFDPVLTRRLIQDAGRSDLAHLTHDLRV